jgi:hypothetical protein
MDYTVRTTPSTSCQKTLNKFDVGLRRAYERVVDHSVTDVQWAQAVKPTRNAGLGLRSAPSVADAAYYASMAAAWERCEAIWPDFARLMDDPIREVETRINARLPNIENHVAPLPVDGPAPRQQTVAIVLADADASQLQAAACPIDRARLIAYSAPMATRWLEATPSRTLDKHLSSAELSLTTAVQLGVDVMEGGASCGFCGTIMDSKGIHPCSCMAGGDVTMRHNDVRNIVYRYSQRAGLNAELEKAGILDEPGVFVSLQRPADVLVDGLGVGARPVERVALDIKVINALGAGHYNETLGGPLVAAEAYRTRALAHLDTAARYAARGIRYEPLVFTTQGGCEKHAEAALSSIAEAIAKIEQKTSASVKAEIMQTISMSLARSVAKAILRRKKRRWRPFSDVTSRVAAELATLQEEGEDE